MTAERRSRWIRSEEVLLIQQEHAEKGRLRRSEGSLVGFGTAAAPGKEKHRLKRRAKRSPDDGQERRESGPVSPVSAPLHSDAAPRVTGPWKWGIPLGCDGGDAGIGAGLCCVACSSGSGV